MANKNENTTESKGNVSPVSITDKAAQTIMAHKNKASSNEQETPSVVDSEIESVKKKRKRRTTKPKQEDIQAERIAAQLDELFDPKHFRSIVRAPADLMLAASGRKLWDLPDKEVDTLAESGAICAKNFIKTDPKWVALFMFSMSLVTVYGGRTAFHFKEIRDEKKRGITKKETENASV